MQQERKISKETTQEKHTFVSATEKSGQGSMQSMRKPKVYEKIYNFLWLRTSMLYHKFSNLQEQFKADLGGKLNKNVGSLDFDTLPCNYNTRKKVNGECPYNNICCKSIVVYKATCDITKKFYIGCTQQKLKNRITQHFNEAMTSANKRLSSN